jgi:rSAM/selenodomain-associated transferase 2
MRLAVIIPTQRDDAALTLLLARFADFEPTPHEVIVVDGAESPMTELICRTFGATWLPSRPGRGGQLVLGVARARADILWFVHADCEPAPEALRAIHHTIENGAAGGYFKFRFAGARTPIKRFLEWCIRLRCMFGMVYGDQGIFVTRAAYDATPGMSIQPLFEEAMLVRALKSTGRFIGLDLPIDVSPRRWERDGFIVRTLLNRILAVGYALGISPARLARWYGTRTSTAGTHKGEDVPRTAASGSRPVRKR